MYINEGVNKKYCYACENIWDKANKKYHTPGKCIGYLDVDQSFVPNKFLTQLFIKESSSHSFLSEHEKQIIDTVISKYGDEAKLKALNPLPKRSQRTT
jgi:hypothetical protein